MAAAVSVWLLAPAPLHNSLWLPISSSSHNHSSSSSACRRPLFLFNNHPTRRGKRLSSSSSLVTKTKTKTKTKEQEEEDAPASSSSSDGSESEPAPATYNYKDDPNFRGCKGCGRDDIERGCNGDGRIKGGIAAVPGFGWWPIKAYRPCPGFLASGGRYRRQGQSMDDIAGGSGKKRSPPKKQQVEVVP